MKANGLISEWKSIGFTYEPENNRYICLAGQLLN